MFKAPSILIDEQSSTIKSRNKQTNNKQKSCKHFLRLISFSYHNICLKLSLKYSNTPRPLNDFKMFANFDHWYKSYTLFMVNKFYLSQYLSKIKLKIFHFPPLS